MEVVAVVLILVLLMKGSSSSSTPDQHDGHSDSNTNHDDTSSGSDPVGDLLDAGEKVAGALGLGGLGTGGLAAAGGGGAATLGTGSAPVVATHTAAGAGAGTGGGGAAGTGGAVPGAAVTATVAPFEAGGLVIVGIVVVIIICNEIAKAQVLGKDLQAKFRQLGLPKARALNAFEAMLASYQWTNVHTHLEADHRLDVYHPASGITSPGQRVVYEWTPAPAPAPTSGGGRKSDSAAARGITTGTATLAETNAKNAAALPLPSFARMARVLGWEYLRWRSEYACRLNRNWGIAPFITEVGWPTNRGASETRFGRDWNDQHLYDEEPWAQDLSGSLAGLPGVPLITGRTEAVRSDYASPDGHPVEELRAPVVDQQVAPGDRSPFREVGGTGDADFRFARLIAFVQVALWACRNAPILNGHTDARVMSQVLINVLELTGDEASIEQWTGPADVVGDGGYRLPTRIGLRLPAATWGGEYRFDVMIAKSGGNALSVAA